jgi:hypothetical protein
LKRMVLIMSKYIPKVGEAFEWQTFRCDWKKENAVVFETEKQIAFINCKGLMEVISKNIDFRPAPTKSDVERERLLAILKEEFLSDLQKVNVIQQAGFTIPKKVERVDIFKLIHENECSDNYLTNEICKLLGDLVEQDKGGAE